MFSLHSFLLVRIRSANLDGEIIAAGSSQPCLSSVSMPLTDSADLRSSSKANGVRLWHLINSYFYYKLVFQEL